MATVATTVMLVAACAVAILGRCGSVVGHLLNETERGRELLPYLSCGTGNPVDDCWRCHDWDSNRKTLADCAIGFGRNAMGGRDGRFYVVTDPSDDAADPRPGTLRHAIIQTEPLWIIFQRDMVIQAEQELLVNSYKTIDGRGANVHIANGGCLSIHFVSHVIVHGIHIHDCVPRGDAMVRSSPSHVAWHSRSDGDGISVLGSTDVWVDHCSLSSCADGLIDVTRASSRVTVSNNVMTHHDKAMLLGHSDDYVADTAMRVTVAYNHFGEGLVQRMPRCRYGLFDVVNNDYTHWIMYAIGGSANPTINSRGNRFMAMNEKQVTQREHTPERQWRLWNWRSQGDLFLNGAYFVESGSSHDGAYSRASSLSARPSSMVASLTSSAGVLSCRKGSRC